LINPDFRPRNNEERLISVLGEDDDEPDFVDEADDDEVSEAEVDDADMILDFLKGISLY
jgi:hypothetical protein